MPTLKLCTQKGDKYAKYALKRWKTCDFLGLGIVVYVYVQGAHPVAISLTLVK